MSARQSRNRKISSTKKSPKRSSVKTNKRKNTKLKKYIVALCLFIVSSLFLLGYLFINRLNKQFVGAESVNAFTPENPGYYTVLFATIDDFSSDVPLLKSIEFNVFDLEDNKITRVKLNSNLSIYSGGKYGEVDVSKLYSLSKLNAEDDDDRAIQQINQIIAGIFAFPVDRYVFTDLTKSETWEGVFTAGSYIPYLADVAFSGNKNHYYTNMDLEAVYKMSTFISSLPQERIFERDFLEIQLENLDEDFREMTLDARFAQEAKSIAVLNASGKSGIAGEAARMVKNLGGRVVSIANADTQFNENFIVSDLDEDFSTQYLAGVFGISKVVSKEEAVSYINNNELHRADIVIVVGQ